MSSTSLKANLFAKEPRRWAQSLRKLWRRWRLSFLKELQTKWSFCWKWIKMNDIWECIDWKGLLIGRREPCYAIWEGITVKIGSHFLRSFSFSLFFLSSFTFSFTPLYFLSFPTFYLWFFHPHFYIKSPYSKRITLKKEKRKTSHRPANFWENIGLYLRG